MGCARNTAASACGVHDTDIQGSVSTVLLLCRGMSQAVLRHEEGHPWRVLWQDDSCLRQWACLDTPTTQTHGIRDVHHKPFFPAYWVAHCSSRVGFPLQNHNCWTDICIDLPGILSASALCSGARPHRANPRPCAAGRGSNLVPCKIPRPRPVFRGGARPAGSALSGESRSNSLWPLAGRKHSAQYVCGGLRTQAVYVSKRIRSNQGRWESP